MAFGVFWLGFYWTLLASEIPRFYCRFVLCAVILIDSFLFQLESRLYNGWQNVYGMMGWYLLYDNVNSNVRDNVYISSTHNENREKRTNTKAQSKAKRSEHTK
jgi:hypothetical protein